MFLTNTQNIAPTTIKVTMKKKPDPMDPHKITKHVRSQAI